MGNIIYIKTKQKNKKKTGWADLMYAFYEDSGL